MGNTVLRHSLIKLAIELKYLQKEEKIKTNVCLQKKGYYIIATQLSQQEMYDKE